MSTARPAEPDEIEIRGGPGRASAAAIGELWSFRGVAAAFTVREIKVKYKQAAIGVLWALLQPLVAAGLFALVLGRFAGVSAEGRPYFLVALAGMVVWTFFATAVAVGSESLIRDQALLRKVFFPREVLPLSSVAAALADLVPGLLVLLAVSTGYARLGLAELLVLPLVLAPAVLAAAAAALALGALNVYYRDVRHALPFLIQLGLFATPVGYPGSLLPDAWRTGYLVVNPVAGAIEGLRSVVVDERLPDLGVTAGGLAWAGVLAAGGYAIFKRLERGFADRV